MHTSPAIRSSGGGGGGRGSLAVLLAVSSFVCSATPVAVAVAPGRAPGLPCVSSRSTGRRSAPSSAASAAAASPAARATAASAAPAMRAPSPAAVLAAASAAAAAPASRRTPWRCQCPHVGHTHWSRQVQPGVSGECQSLRVGSAPPCQAGRSPPARRIKSAGVGWAWRRRAAARPCSVRWLTWRGWRCEFGRDGRRLHGVGYCWAPFGGRGALKSRDGKSRA